MNRPDDDRPIWLIPKIPGTRIFAAFGLLVVLAAAAAAVGSTIAGRAPAPEAPQR